MIPCASDDFGSVDLELSNLEDIKKDSSDSELTGKKRNLFFKKEMSQGIGNPFSFTVLGIKSNTIHILDKHSTS